MAPHSWECVLGVEWGVRSSFTDQTDLFYREAPCVFFDCDGVIFDSNGFKLEALRYALAGYPQPALEQMELFWSANGGMARYRKLEHFFVQVLGEREGVAERVAATAARFGEFSRRAYDPSQPIAEALELARDAGAERCFVVSGADQAELRDVFQAKELSARFAQICGSPVTKLAHVQRILAERACAPERALLIGDGAGDFEVCQTLGLPFIYLDQYSEWRAAEATLARASQVISCSTWQELLARLLTTPASSAENAAR